MSRALVLGGGGPVGIAWEAGLIAGLLEGGVDLSEADFIMGTSAGSFVGSQLAMGRSAADMAAAIVAEAERHRSAADIARPPAGAASGAPSGAATSERPAAPNLMPLMRMMQEAAAGTRDAQEVRKEIGAFAMGAKTVDEATFIKSFGRQLSGEQAEGWPAKAYACTAVDAESGEFVVWNNDSKVGLARACVASSCSVLRRRLPADHHQRAAATSMAACARAPTPMSPRATSALWWWRCASAAPTRRRRSASRRCSTAKSRR